MADSLAKAAAQGLCGLTAPSLHELPALRHPDGTITCGPVPRLFLAYLGGEARRAYPEIADDHFVIIKLAPTACPTEVLWPAFQKPAAVRAHKDQKLVIATYNVMTLDYGDCKAGPQGSMAPRKLAAMQSS